MRRYYIKRTGPNTGIVTELGAFGEMSNTTEEMTYLDCREYLKAHQEELKVYKVAVTSKRKNAKRHLLKKIYARDDYEAGMQFVALMSYMAQHGECDKGSVYELMTGDWKPVQNNLY